MHWLFINGSPRKNGNTADAVSLLRDALASPSDTVQAVEIYSRDIQPCIDCRACKKDGLVCTRNDGMAGLYDELERADTIVCASPIYWSGVTGPMKNLIDRLRPYFKNEKLSGKRLLLVSIGANADSQSDLIDGMYGRVAGSLGMAVAGHLRVNAFDVGDLANAGLTKESIRSSFGL